MEVRDVDIIESMTAWMRCIGTLDFFRHSVQLSLHNNVYISMYLNVSTCMYLQLHVDTYTPTWIKSTD